MFWAVAAQHILHAGLVRWKSIEKEEEREKDHGRRERAEVTKR